MFSCLLCFLANGGFCSSYFAHNQGWQWYLTMCDDMITVTLSGQIWAQKVVFIDSICLIFEVVIAGNSSSCLNGELIAKTFLRTQVDAKEVLLRLVDSVSFGT